MQRTISITLAALLPIAAFAYGGCKSDKKADQSETAGKTVEQTDQAALETFEKERMTFVEDMQQRLKDVDADIEQLHRRVDTMSEDAQAQMKESIDELEEQRETLNTAIDKAKVASAEEWSAIKQGIDEQVSSFTSKYNAVLQNMQMTEESPTEPEASTEPAPSEEPPKSDEPAKPDEL